MNVVTVFAIVCGVCIASECNNTTDYAAEQLERYKSDNPVAGILTTNAGAPVFLTDANKSINTNIFENHYLVDMFTHFHREKIPTRIVHPVGVGALGYFEVTHDVTKYTKAKFLNKIGKKTPIAVRFSISFGEEGAGDLTNGGKGFAIKFYTEDGNLDLTALGTPIFLFRDPIFQPSFSHSNFRNPVTHIRDRNASLDFNVNVPETFNALFYTARNQIPYGWRHFNSFPIHSFEVENDDGDIHYVRFSFINDQGEKYLTSDEAAAILAEDSDFAKRDLYNAIEGGDYPSWTMNIQVMTPEQIENATFDPFNVNKVWPEKLYPSQPIGRFVLNRNPSDYFSDVEQSAYCPCNLVPGINGAPDATFQVRSFAYHDCQLYRLGVNFNQLPINKPNHFLNNDRDGFMVYKNQGASPNYYPNSWNGPMPVAVARSSKSIIGKLVPKEREIDSTFAQSTELYEEMSETERQTFSANVASTLTSGAKVLQERALDIFAQIHPDFSTRVKAALEA